MSKKSVLALSKVIFIKILITFFSVCFSMFCLLFPIKLYLNDSVCVQMSMGHDQKWYGLPSTSSQMNRIDRDSVWVCQRVSEQLSKVRFHGLESCPNYAFPNHYKTHRNQILCHEMVRRMACLICKILKQMSGKCQIEKNCVICKQLKFSFN